MGLQQVSRAAVDGKRPVSKASQTSEFFAKARRLTFAAVAFFLTAFAASTSYAQSSAFAGMAGTWSGPGTVTGGAVHGGVAPGSALRNSAVHRVTTCPDSRAP